MDLDKVVRLVRLLTERTIESHTQWKEDSSNYFTTVVGRQKVAIMERYADNEPDFVDPDYVLCLVKDSGEWIDSFSDSELKPVASDSFRMMGDLFRAAKRNASGVPKIIDGLLNHLEPF